MEQLELINNIWSSYSLIEERIIDFLKIIPYNKTNRSVWSPILTNIYLDIGSQIDSIFRNFVDDLYVSKCHIETTKKKKSDRYDINDYRNLYNPIYSFDQDIIYLLHFRTEFKPWKKWTCTDNPNWWKAHNKIKHDRYSNLEQSTLENTLISLSGLFILCIKFHPMLGFLVDKRIIRGDDEPSFIKYNLLKADIGKYSHIVKPIIAKTSLFGYVYKTHSNWCKENPWECLTSAGRPGQVTDQVYSF